MTSSDPTLAAVRPAYSLQPITLAEAQAFVRKYHRHNANPPPGWKFGIGLTDGDHVVGIVMVGRPVSRHLDDGLTLEVNRCCIDGYQRNAASKLYAAAWRAARALGYRRLVTYTLKTESGASLRGAGWRVVHETRGASWSCPSRPRVDTHKIADRYLWEAHRHDQ